jgi:hypothetical protein
MPVGRFRKAYYRRRRRFRTDPLMATGFSILPGFRLARRWVLSSAND